MKVEQLLLVEGAENLNEFMIDENILVEWYR